MQPSDILQSIQDDVSRMLRENGSKELASYLEDIATPIVEQSKFTPASIGDCLATIVKNIPSNKYIFSIVITACLKKIIDPSQDIRIAQDNMTNGYSNRSLDQRIITPFLKRYGYTHCEASGLESGRNLERPSIWNLSYQANPRGLGNRESFLSVLDFVQVKSGDARKVITFMLYLDAVSHTVAETVQAAPLEESISKIIKVLGRHFNEGSGQGKSRLPVLALYAYYQQAKVELGRYANAELKPLERHTTADLRSGSIGDIQFDKIGTAFEGIEVKSEKPVTSNMIYELSRKFRGLSISRYYILTTNKDIFKQEDREFIDKAIAEVSRTTGCQVVVGNVLDSLGYYLHLLGSPEIILTNYALQLESDPDVRPGLISRWNTILSEEYAT